MPNNRLMTAEIASSMEDYESDERRFKRQNSRPFNNFLVTLTTTSTTFVFSTTLIKKPIQLGPAPIPPAVNGVLNCLPSGYVLC